MRPLGVTDLDGTCVVDRRDDAVALKAVDRDGDARALGEIVKCGDVPTVLVAVAVPVPVRVDVMEGDTSAVVDAEAESDGVTLGERVGRADSEEARETPPPKLFDADAHAVELALRLVLGDGDADLLTRGDVDSEKETVGDDVTFTDGDIDRDNPPEAVAARDGDPVLDGPPANAVGVLIMDGDPVRDPPAPSPTSVVGVAVDSATLPVVVGVGAPTVADIHADTDTLPVTVALAHADHDRLPLLVAELE